MSSFECKSIVPDLRFPEFRNSGSWEKIEFIDVADKDVKWSFIGGPFGSNLKSSDYVESGIRIIQLQNIGDGQFFNKYKIYTSREKADELLSNNIYSGDIILSKMGDPVGRACLVPHFHERYVMCSDGIRLVVDEKKHSKYFIYSLINSVPFRTLIEKSSTGSTRKRIGLDNLKKLPMYVPVVRDEQQKIADCLAALDDLINAHNEKLDTLNNHKKGLMQQLFPAVGETLPKRRFPEFHDDWEEKSLDDICKSISSGKDKTDPNGEIELYGSTGILGKTAKASYDGSYILVARVGANAGLLSEVKGSFGVTDNTLVIHFKNPEYIRFYYYLLKNFNLNRLVFGSGQPLVTGKQLKALKFYFPKKDEKRKIADCLSFIDKQITSQTQKVESLKTHKKGLMQKLFPN